MTPTGKPIYSALNISAYPPKIKQKGFVLATWPVKSRAVRNVALWRLCDRDSVYIVMSDLSESMMADELM